MDDVLKQNARVLKDPAPVVRVSVLADSSIDISLKPWVNVPDFAAAEDEINKAIVEEFRARDIEMPFPQREVRLRNPPTVEPGADDKRSEAATNAKPNKTAETR